MNRLRWVVATLVAVVALATAAGPSAASTEPTVEAAVHDGEIAVTNPGVVTVRTSHRDGTWYVCSGVWLAPDWVATAGHCVAPRDAAPVTAMEVVAPVLHPSPAAWRSDIVEIHLHPDYTGDPERADGDLAVVRTAAPHPDVDTGGPYRSWDLLAPGSDELAAGTRTVVYGYGFTDRLGSVSRHLNRIRLTVNDPAVCLSRGVNMVTARELCLENLEFPYGSPCPGDSGGPVFATVGGQTRLVALFTTYYANPAFGCEDTFALTKMVRLAPHRGWIREVTGIGAVVSVATDADGSGLWALHADGTVRTRGDAVHRGDLAGTGAAPTSIAVRPEGDGYWIFTADGAVTAFGAATHHGDMRGIPLNGSVVDAAVTPSGEGYWMIGTDGGVFTFGDARFAGSMGGQGLNEPVVGIVADPDGSGYWLVAADGGIFSFDAGFRGSVPGALPAGASLNRPVIGALAYGDGYLMVASDGGVFVFSDRAFSGSLGDRPPASRVVGVAAFADPDRSGYWLADGDGGLYPFGAAVPFPGL